MYERESVHVHIGTHGGQYSKFDTLSLELQGVLSLNSGSMEEQDKLLPSR